MKHITKLHQLLVQSDGQFISNLCFKHILLLCFLQITGQTLGSLVMTLKVINCMLKSRGVYSLKKKLPFLSEDCTSKSCPNRVRFSFSLEQLQDLTSTTWDIECDVEFCYTGVRLYQTILTIHTNTTRQLL